MGDVVGVLFVVLVSLKKFMFVGLFDVCWFVVLLIVIGSEIDLWMLFVDVCMFV